jgi:hypothetical protein
MLHFACVKGTGRIPQLPIESFGHLGDLRGGPFKLAKLLPFLSGASTSAKHLEPSSPTIPLSERTRHIRYSISIMVVYTSTECDIITSSYDTLSSLLSHAESSALNVSLLARNCPGICSLPWNTDLTPSGLSGVGVS